MSNERESRSHEGKNMEAHSLMLELCHQLGAKDGENMVDMLWGAVRDAKRYRHLRAHWDDFTGYAARDPGPWLDSTIDAVLSIGESHVER